MTGDAGKKGSSGNKTARIPKGKNLVTMERKQN